MDKHNEITTATAEETAKVGEEIAHKLAARIICLYGDLGSGKTTFTQGFAKGLGITTRLLSPTFIIVRRYDLSEHRALYHIDLYRLQSVSQMEELGLSEIFADQHAIVVIEWAERLGELLPKERMDIHFAALANEKHTIDIR